MTAAELSAALAPLLAELTAQRKLLEGLLVVLWPEKVSLHRAAVILGTNEATAALIMRSHEPDERGEK